MNPVDAMISRALAIIEMYYDDLTSVVVHAVTALGLEPGGAVRPVPAQVTLTAPVS